jgi:hypothetical protein
MTVEFGLAEAANLLIQLCFLTVFLSLRTMIDDSAFLQIPIRRFRSH